MPTVVQCQNEGSTIVKPRFDGLFWQLEVVQRSMRV